MRCPSVNPLRAAPPEQPGTFDARLENHASATAVSPACRTADLAHARGGNVAIITALVMTAMIGCGAMAVDLGALSHDRRSLQSSTDAAAMAAVIPILQSQAINATPDTSRLSTIVSAALAANGYSNAVVDSAVAGTYCPDSTVASGSRFTAGSSTCATNLYTGPVPNAVQTTVHVQSPYYLAQAIMNGQTGQTITVTSTAIGMDEAGFTIGTGLINVNTANSAILNGVLGGMLGTSLSLSAVSYSGLANTQINTLKFLTPIATNASVNVATIGGLASATAGLGTILQAEATALNSAGTLTTVQTNALTGLQGLNTAVYGNPSVQMGQLLNAGAWLTTSSDGTTSPTALSASVNAFQVANAAIQLANGSHSVTVPTSGLNLPNVASLTVSSTVGSPATSTFPGGGMGFVGTAATTSQVNLQVGLTATPSTVNLGLASATVAITLPVTVTLANGTAQLTGISCGANPATDSVVTIKGTTSVATINATLSANVVVQVLGLSVLNATVTVPVSTQVGAGGPTTLTFTQTDIANQNVKRISSTDVLSTTTDTLMASLSSQANTKISVQVLGISSPLISAILSPLATAIGTSVTVALAALSPVLDTVINNVANALGVEVGYMDVTATGVRCGVPAIVH